MIDILSSSIESIKAIYHPQIINISRKFNLSEGNRFFTANEALGIVRALISIYQNCLSHGNINSQTLITVEIVNNNEVAIHNGISDHTKGYIIKNNYIDKVKNFSPDSDYNKLISEGGTGLYKIYRYLVDSSASFDFDIQLNGNIFSQKVML